MKVFSLIGFMYALGDYLEMASPLEAMFLTDLEAASVLRNCCPNVGSDCTDARRGAS